jgi:diguanylate cyclase
VEIAVLQTTSEPHDDLRAARLSRSIRLTQAGIAGAYFYDLLALSGFYWAGFIPLPVLLGVGAAVVLVTVAVAFAHESGWSRRRKDPTLFLPQQLWTMATCLGALAAAPQIGFQPLATLFSISAFSFMAPNPRTLLLSWGAAASGAAVVIFLEGPRLSMPTATFAGQALTLAVVIGVLARCLCVSVFFRGLQRRLAEKNIALKAAVDQIAAMANHDELTGLPNRRSITNSLAEQVALCARTGVPLCVAMLDIDHFKQINDTYGHLAGDRTLQMFAKTVSEALRTADSVGRYGGEEFLIVLVGAKLNDTVAPLERIRAHVFANDWSPIASDLHVTLTIGAAEHAPGESIENLLRRADLALYRGKEAGRDRVVLDSAT